MSGDTLTRVEPRTPGLRRQLWLAFAQAVCRRWGHHMRLYGSLPFATRHCCTRCGSNMLRFRADAAEVWATEAELLAAEPRFAEALYEGRWGEPPRQKLLRGQWPAV